MAQNRWNSERDSLGVSKESMMENWQFFLQKEGDYAWLPLETPQVEILEGRYQLIAHTANPGQSVQVNIRHQYEQADIPQENIQESIRHIGLSGKVEILPLVYLGLGSWSIACHPDVDASESNSQSSESYQLEIQVLSQDFDLFEDWGFSDLDPLDGGVPDANPSVSHPSVSMPALSEMPQEGLSTSPSSTVMSSCDAAVESAPAPVADSLMAGLDETHEPIPRKAESTLCLPDFSASVPTPTFRTVSSMELPRPVTDRQLPEVIQSPQLPVFTTAKAAVVTKQSQRFRALTKIKFIAAAVSRRPFPTMTPETRQEKFHSKLNQIAIGAEA